MTIGNATCSSCTRTKQVLEFVNLRRLIEVLRLTEIANLEIAVCVTERHVTSEWVMSRMNKSHVNESCHVWMNRVTYEARHVTYEWVMSHMNESCHIWLSRVTYEWVTCERVMSHMNVMLRMCCVTYEWWVMSHMYTCVYMSHVTYIYMSHVTYEWVTCEWVMSHMNAVTNECRMPHVN